MSNQNDNQIPPMELPNVDPEPGNNVSEKFDAAPQTTEISSAKAVELGISTPTPDPSSGAPADLNYGPQPAVTLFYDPTQQPDPSQAQPAVPTANPMIADDNDLIEKEWVEKAKRIVEQTKVDPRKQTAELHKIKADYLKKRFNKEVKLIEE
jgi:hypothetical protein